MFLNEINILMDVIEDKWYAADANEVFDRKE